MRRRGPVILLAVLVLLAGAFALKRCTGDDGSSTGTGTTAGSGAGDDSHGGRTGAGIRDPQATASISGRVLRADTGAPIANANVALAPAELMRMFVKGGAPTQIATTDASGAWKIANVRPGAYVVAATALEFLPSGKTKLTIAAGEQKTGVDLSLTAGGTTVRGTITDVGGGPIPAARVTAHTGDPREMVSGGMADFVALTNATGQYAITLPDGKLDLEASHEDYASKTQHVELAGKPLTVDFTLIPGSVIRGQVIARDSGKGVPGAIVHADRTSRTGGGGGGDENSTTFADEDGNFTLRSLPSGTLELKALGHGYASTDGTSVPVGIGETVDGVRVLVDRAYSISGHTKRRKGTEPVPGVTLGAFAIIERTFGVALEPSAKDGAFEIVGLRAGSYTIFAVGEGSVPDIGTNVTVVDKDVTGVVVELDTGVTLTGRVEPPVAGAEMSVQMTEAIGISNMFDAAKTILVHGETDGTGAFVLKNVPAGNYKLDATAKDGAKGSTPIVVADVDQSNLLVKLSPRASIAGHVADTSGNSAADISVSVKRLDAEPARDQTMMFRGGGDDVTTSADGAFKITGLDAGKYRVRASYGSRFGRRRGGGAKAGDKDDKSSTEIVVAAGEAKAGVQLAVEARDGTITGIVMGTDKHAIGDAWVRARPAVKKEAGVETYGDWGGEPSPPVLTSADGRFTIKKLVHGTYDLEVEGPRGTTHGEKPGVNTGDDTTVELLSFGSLSGVVTLGGAPVVKYTIDCRVDGPTGGGNDSTRLVEAKDGAYSIEHLQPNASYKCSVESDGGTGSGTIAIPAGAAKLDIVLTKWASVAGIVVSVIDHQPIANVHVFAGGENSARDMSAVLAGNAPTTDATGHFSLDHVAVGKGHVAVMPKRGFAPLGGADYVVAEGQHVDVGTIAVAPPHDGPDGTYGLTTRTDGDKLLVDQVFPDGPAAAAGVQTGDQISSLDGIDVAKLTPPIAEFLLSSGNVGVGTPAVLSLTRAGSTTPVLATVTSVKW